jgi:hypothetical protein
LRRKKARLRGEAQPNQKERRSPDERIHQWERAGKDSPQAAQACRILPRAHPFMVHEVKRGFEYA